VYLPSTVPKEHRKENKVKEPSGKTGTGLEPNVAGVLCYALWWITGIIFLILEKEDKFVHFHALQSIFTFGPITVAAIIVGYIPFIGWILGSLLWILGFILWIVLMVKAYQGQKYKIPVAGDIAENKSKPSA
jgi:uncharacterized membrane protein